MLRHFFVIFLLLCCAACGGSSGDTIVTNINDVGGDHVTCILADCSTAANFKTSEYNLQRGLEIINAAEAYSYLYNANKNYLGDDVIVAVIDTGVLGTHLDLRDNYNASLSVGDATASNSYDANGHGTHVAGIIASSLNNMGMHGVAPKAEIVSIAYSGIGGVGPGTSNFHEYVINSKATVVNMSYGSEARGNNYDKYRAIIEQSEVSDKIVLVGAAGNSRTNRLGSYEFWNDSADNPIYPAHYAKDDAYNALMGQMLAVTAVNSSPYNIRRDFTSVGGTDYVTSSYSENCVGAACITRYSNYCGDTQKYCLAAPGGDATSYAGDSNNYGIYSTYINSVDTSNAESYGSLSGTSMASPHVAGAAAVLQGAWPNLSGEEVVDILLSTATYLNCSNIDLAGSSTCNEASDEVGSYNNVTGRGLLNLEAAVQNIGTSSLYVANNFSGNSYSLTDTSLTLSATFGDALTNSALLKQAVFFDQYQRDYPIDLSSKINKRNTASFELSNYFANLTQRPVNFSFGNIIDFSINQQSSLEQSNLRNRQNLTPFAQEDSDLAGSFNFKQKINQASFAFNYSKANEFVTEAEFSGFMALTARYNNFYDLAGDERIKASFSYPVVKNLSFYSDIRHGLDSESHNSSIISSGLSLLGKSQQLKFTYSLSEYKEEFWGSSGTEAFSLGNDNYGRIYDLSYLKKITKDLSLFLNYQYSQIDDNIAPGIIQEIKNLAADKFAISLNKKTKSGQYGFGFALPPAIISGEANLSIATSRDEQAPVLASEKLDLTSKERERIYEFYYQTNLDEFALRMNFFLKDNFNHIGDAKDEVILLSLQRNF